MDITVNVDQNSVNLTKQFIEKKKKQYSNWTPVLKKISLLMYRSVIKNFEDEGRPVKWKPLSVLTKFIKSHRSGGRKERNPKILQDSGDLKKSIIPHIEEDSRNATVSVGSNLSYAKLQHYGGFGTGGTVKISPFYRKSKGTAGNKKYIASNYVKGFTMTIKAGHKIPPRPFMLIQKEDEEQIRKWVRGYVIEQP